MVDLAQLLEQCRRGNGPIRPAPGEHLSAPFLLPGPAFGLFTFTAEPVRATGHIDFRTRQLWRINPETGQATPEPSPASPPHPLDKSLLLTAAMDNAEQFDRAYANTIPAVTELLPWAHNPSCPHELREEYLDQWALCTPDGLTVLYLAAAPDMFRWLETA